MHAVMYADLFAWRGTLIIVLLFAVPYVIYDLYKNKKSQNDEPEETDD